MKKKSKLLRASVMLLTLTLLMVNVNAGVNESTESPDAVYSDWTGVNGLRAGSGRSSDLADFLDGFEVEGAEPNAQGEYVILENVPYTVRLQFSEKMNGIQFDDGPGGCTLTYAFPEGFTPADTSGTIELEGEAGPVLFDYVISNGTLTVTADTSSPGYATALTSETLDFGIYATGVLTRENISFSDEISGKFIISNERRVSVRKIGEYDPSLNRIKYTILAESKGNNTNIHIGDTTTGSALTYVPGSLSVTSNVRDEVPWDPDTQGTETFGLTIPSMVHGEVVSVVYYADVDLSKLTYKEKGRYGIASETANSVRIWSEEDPGPHEIEITEDDFDHHITLSSNRKTASAPTVHGDKTYVTWTVVLNEDANVSIAGSHVTDTIDPACQSFVRYTGSGIHIEKYLKGSDTPSATSDVSWGTNGLSASHGGSTWSYTIPQSDADHAYRYVITYETEVDSEDLLQTTAISNTVENEYDTDYGGVNIVSTGEGVSAEKTAVSSSVNAAEKKAETEWEITFTVPSTGLDSAVVTDTVPGFLNSADMIWYWDTYREGSVRVGEGDLLQGEAFTVVSSPADHQVTITFTKNDGEPGLTGTGQPRTIHVFLTTDADRTWLEYAKEHSRARTHVNNAVVRVNGQDIHVTASAIYNTTGYDLEKTMTGVYYTSTEPALPIYMYRIVLTGLDDGAFDEDGYLTFTDTYDANYLAYHRTFQNNDNYYVNSPNGHIYGNTQWNPYLLSNPGPYVVDSATEGQLVFKLNKNTLPKTDGTGYYPIYMIVYGLQIKDADTLAAMKEQALHNDGLSVKLENTVGSDEFGSTTTVTEYTVEALDKRLVSEGDTNGTHEIEFELTVNPQGLRIGDSDTITVKDTLTNLSFDYVSITIDPQLDGDILNRSGNSIIMTLHNEQKYTITYTTRLVGLSDISWNNRAELFGYVKGLSGISSIESGGHGSYQVYGMNVWKYAQGDMNQGLAATFELYEARTKDSYGNDIAEPVWVKVGEFTTDAETGIYEIRTVHREGISPDQSLRPYSYHDADGNELFGNDESESYGWRYRVIETVAPPGFRKTTTVYEFGISDVPSYSAPYNYLNYDTVTVVNKPEVPSTETEIAGEKVLIGKELEDQEFTFTLVPEENDAARWGEGYPGGFTGSMSVKNDAAGRFSFPLTYTYEDYTNAVSKGFVDDAGRACFRYVVTEELPEGAQGNQMNGIIYDDSRYLVTVRLYLEGDQLKTDIGIELYVEVHPLPVIDTARNTVR